MAQPTVLPGTKLLILVGDGNSPEVFSEPCGLTTKGIDFSSSTNETLIPDCADPEAPAWSAKDVNSLSASVTGAGVMAVESFDVWNDWFLAAEPKNCQIKLDSTSLGYWAGQFILTALKYGGQRGQKVTIDVTLANDGAVTWVNYLSSRQIELSAATVSDTASIGDIIGVLSVLNGAGIYAFTLTSNPGGLFSITAENLKVAAALSAGSYPITIHADNGAGSVLDRVFLITVTYGGTEALNFSIASNSMYLALLEDI